MAQKKEHPSQGVLPFEDSVENTIQEKPSLEETINTKKNYGITTKWLIAHFDAQLAENCYYGLWNITLPHDILIRSQPSYIVALYNGAAIKKRPTIHSEPISYNSPEELITELIFVGRNNVLPNVKKGTIEKKVQKHLGPLLPKIKYVVMESFEKPYHPSNSEEPQRAYFIDPSYGCTSKEAARRSLLREFFFKIQDMYQQNSQ